MTTLRSKGTSLRNMVQTVAETWQSRREADEAFWELHEELTSVKGLIGEDGSTTIGRRLIKAGMFLIVAIPEPFISDLTGSALVATGLTLDRLSKKEDIREVYKKLQENLQEIEHLRREASQITIFPE